MTTTTALVPIFAGTISGQPAQLCNARDLHAFLKVGRDFATWIKDRIDNGRFVEGEDYKLDSPKRGNQKAHGGDRRSRDYHLVLDMAKHLALLENNEVGDQVRRYFIAIEKAARANSAAGNANATALPAPKERVSPALRDHIMRVAHQVALHQLDNIYAMLTTCADEQLAAGASENACANKVSMMAHSADGTAIVNLQDLKDIIRGAEQTINAAAKAIGAIHRIEQRNGHRLRLLMPSTQDKGTDPLTQKYDRLVREVLERIAAEE